MADLKLDANTFDPIREGHAMQGRVLAVAELADDAAQLDRTTNPDVVVLGINIGVKEELATFLTAKGIDLAPAGAEAKVRTQLELQQDIRTMRDALAFDKNLTATLQYWSEKLEGAMAPPTERDQMRGDMRRLVLYHEWAGRTLADVARAYEGTADTADSVFVSLVETNRGDLPRVLRLQPDDGDIRATLRLKELVAARREGRADPAARVALEALSALRTLPRQAAIDASRRGKLQVARLPFRGREAS